MDYAALVSRFVAERFPRADAVILAGSTATGRRTATSDIDLLILDGGGMLPDGQDALAATFAFEGEAVEVFAYTEAGFDRWALKGVTEFRPVIVHMLLEGRVLREAAMISRLRERWAPVIAAGPYLDTTEQEARRYALTDLLDDLADATDRLEQRVLADAVFVRTAELLLLTHGRWLGSGKNLVRRLRAWDAPRAAALASPLLAGDIPAFHSAATEELTRGGGRLHSGYRR